jgi:hypothetical protein
MMGTALKHAPTRVGSVQPTTRFEHTAEKRTSSCRSAPDE